MNEEEDHFASMFVTPSIFSLNTFWIISLHRRHECMVFPRQMAPSASRDERDQSGAGGSNGAPKVIGPVMPAHIAQARGDCSLRASVVVGIITSRWR